jgi:hypothetical protein
MVYTGMEVSGRPVYFETGTSVNFNKLAIFGDGGAIVLVSLTCALNLKQAKKRDRGKMRFRIFY